MTDEKLTTAEQAELAECEAVIEQNLPIIREMLPVNDLADYHQQKAEYHIREAIRLRDEAFKKFGVWIPLPFDLEEGRDD